MAGVYTVPQFPLAVKIWHANVGPFPIVAAPDITTVGALRLRKDGIVAAVGGTGPPSTLLLLPKGTDIRSTHFGGFVADSFECPAGSGRYYTVSFVEDVAKGFPNEYRCAVGYQRFNTANGWPYPTP